MNSRAIKLSAALGVLAKIASIVGRFLVAGFIGPAGYALIAIVTNVLKWMGLVNMSILSVALREIPILLKNSEHLQAQRLYHTMTSLYLATSCISLVVPIVYYFANDSIDATILAAVFLLKSTSVLLSLTQAYLKGDGDFESLALLNGMLAIAFPISTIFATYFFGVFGFFVALFASELILSLNFFSATKFKFVSVSIFEFKSLIARSLPTYLTNVLDSLLLSFPILFFSFSGDLDKLGIVGFYMTMLSAKNLPLMTVLAPMIKRGYTEVSLGETDADSIFQETIFKVELIISTIVAAISVAFLFVLNAYLPEFRETASIQYLFIFVAFVICNRFWYYSYAQVVSGYKLVIGLLASVFAGLAIFSILDLGGFLEVYLIALALLVFIVRVNFIVQVSGLKTAFFVLIRDAFFALAVLLCLNVLDLHSVQTLNVQSGLSLLGCLTTILLTSEVLFRLQFSESLVLASIQFLRRKS